MYRNLPQFHTQPNNGISSPVALNINNLDISEIKKFLEYTFSSNTEMPLVYQIWPN